MSLTQTAYRVLAWKTRIKWIAIGYALGAATGHLQEIVKFFSSL